MDTNHILSIHEVEDAIHSISKTLASLARPDIQARDFSLPDVADNGDWWVLVCGDTFDPESFDQREQARERLRRIAEAQGIGRNEYIWVWDDTAQAQFLESSYFDRKEAEIAASHLYQLGLSARVIKKPGGY